MTDHRVLAMVYVGVSASVPMSPDDLCKLWKQAIALVLAQDPGLVHRIWRSQVPLVTVVDGQYVALILAPDQGALIDHAGKPVLASRRDVQRPLLDETEHLIRMMAEAAARTADTILDVRQAIEGECDPLQAIDALEMDPETRKSLTHAVVNGLPKAELEIASTKDRYAVEPGQATRRTVLGLGRLRLEVCVVGMSRADTYLIRPTAQSRSRLPFEAAAELKLRVPDSMRSAHVLLMAAWATHRPVTLTVVSVTSIVSGHVREVLLCAMQHWDRELAATLPHVPAPPILKAHEVSETTAGWGLRDGPVARRDR